MAIQTEAPSPTAASPAALRCSLLIERPHDLHPDAYAMEITGNCLAPLFMDGDYAVVEPVLPAVGDIAAVYLTDEDLPLIKRLTSFDPRWLNNGSALSFTHQIVLGQTNPHRAFLVRVDRIDKIHRVRGNYASLTA